MTVTRLNPLNDWIRSQPGFIVGDNTEPSVLAIAHTAFERAGGASMTREDFTAELKKAGYQPECQPDRDASPMPPYVWRWVLRMPDGDRP